LALLLGTAGRASEAPSADSGSAAESKPPADSAPDSLDALFEDKVDESEFGAADPLEPLNRHFFSFNEWVDCWVFRPLVRGYQFVVPEFARRSVHHAFANLDTPVIVANDLLQLRVRDAAETSADFVLDTAFGAGGLFEVGEHAGLSREPADFGQTLAYFGVGSGPYLVIPFLGPSTLRDSFGDIIDQALHPLTYLIGPGQRVFVGSVLTGSSGLSTLEANYDQLAALRDSSIDFYVAMRSAYLQNRAAMIQASFSEGLKSYDATSPALSFAIFPSSAWISASSPSRLMIDEYSERLSASSETVPFR
jgi:phospholipid-binding lipoprotein MlaA